MINYDLKQPGKDYEELFKAIKNIDSNPFHALKSSWFVNSVLSASKIFESLKPHIDANDHLIVTEITSNYYGCSDGDLWTWLTKAFSS
jgi:hypothetical protein